MRLRQIALSCLCAGALMAGRADAKCEVTRMMTLPVIVKGNQILIPGTLEGRPVKYLFDTSFLASIIMAPAAERFGLDVMDYMSFIDPTSTVSEGAATVKEFTLADYKVRNALFAVWGHHETFGDPDAVAVLGTDYWHQFDVDIDLKAGTIGLLKSQGCEDVNLAYWTNDYNVLDTVTHSYQNIFYVTLNGERTAAILDSGAPFSSLTRSTALRVGIPSEKEAGDDLVVPGTQSADLLSLTNMSYGLGTPMRPSPDILGGIAESPYLRSAARQTVADFGSLQLDEETIKPARLRIVPTPRSRPQVGSRLGITYFDYDMVFGVDFLLAHHVLIANSQHKLYFSYSGGSALQSVSK